MADTETEEWGSVPTTTEPGTGGENTSLPPQEQVTDNSLNPPDDIPDIVLTESVDINQTSDTEWPDKSLADATSEDKIANDEADDLVLDKAKEETAKVLQSSVDIVSSERAIQEEKVSALAGELVRSTIDLAASQHDQEIKSAAHSLTKQTVESVTDTMEKEFKKVVKDRVTFITGEAVDNAAGEIVDEKVSRLADKVLSDIEDGGAMGDIGDDSVFEYSEDSYLEPIPDPYTQAISYLEQHNILQLFQGLTTKVVFNRPADPLEAMMEQLQLMKKTSQSQESVPSDQQITEENASA